MMTKKTSEELKRFSELMREMATHTSLRDILEACATLSITYSLLADEAERDEKAWEKFLKRQEYIGHVQAKDAGK